MASQFCAHSQRDATQSAQVLLAYPRKPQNAVATPWRMVTATTTVFASHPQTQQSQKQNMAAPTRTSRHEETFCESHEGQCFLTAALDSDGFWLRIQNVFSWDTCSLILKYRSQSCCKHACDLDVTFLLSLLWMFFCTAACQLQSRNSAKKKCTSTLPSSLFWGCQLRKRWSKKLAQGTRTIEK